MKYFQNYNTYKPLVKHNNHCFKLVKIKLNNIKRKNNINLKHLFFLANYNYLKFKNREKLF